MPGLARRADNYEDQLALADRQSGHPELNRLKVDKALALGTAEELTPQERCLMMALLAHLDIAATAAGKTSVWPGSRRLCALLSIGESTLRRLKGSLEEKGFILRRYDRCNRPLKGGALDLSPFLARVEELCQAIGHTERKIGSAVEEDHSERQDHRPKLSAGVPKNERLKRNTQQEISERCLKIPRRVTEDQTQADEETAEQAEAIFPGISQAPLETASTVLGDEKAQRLWHWAEKRHGANALLALAVAAKDPGVKNPIGWFAWYATNADQVDLGEIARRLPKAPSPISEPTDRPGPPKAFFDQFAASAGREAALSYLAPAEITLVAGELVIATQGRLAHERLKGRYREAIMFAAAAISVRNVEIRWR